MTQNPEVPENVTAFEPKTSDELIGSVTAELEKIGLLEAGQGEVTKEKILEKKAKQSEWISLAEAAVRREEDNVQDSSH